MLTKSIYKKKKAEYGLASDALNDVLFYMLMIKMLQIRRIVQIKRKQCTNTNHTKQNSNGTNTNTQTLKQSET